MKWKRVLIDPSFWILLIANSLLVYKYEKSPAIFTTLIWLYWSQNVMYGFFNFMDMLTVKNVDTTGYTVKDNDTSTKRKLADASAWVFFFHYGFFHLVYCIFLLTMKKSGPFDWEFFKNYLAVFFIFQVINFIQHKIANRTQAANIGRMFAIPYLRVIPMHMCILIPAFLNFSSLTVFLVLKVLADVIMYIKTNSYYQRGISQADVTVANIQSALSSE